MNVARDAHARPAHVRNAALSYAQHNTPPFILYYFVFDYLINFVFGVLAAVFVANCLYSSRTDPKCVTNMYD